jgi:flotillin
MCLKFSLHYLGDKLGKIDKVTVWDGMGGKDGTSSTANFLSGLMKSIPPLNELFSMAGMKIPEFLGSEIEKNKPVETVEEVTENEKEEDTEN